MRRYFGFIVVSSASIRRISWRGERQATVADPRVRTPRRDRVRDRPQDPSSGRRPTLGRRWRTHDDRRHHPVGGSCHRPRALLGHTAGDRPWLVALDSHRRLRPRTDGHRILSDASGGFRSSGRGNRSGSPPARPDATERAGQTLSAPETSGSVAEASCVETTRAETARVETTGVKTAGAETAAENTPPR